MSQSGNFLHSVGTMWIYVNTLWWINAQQWQFAFTVVGTMWHYGEHTVVNTCPLLRLCEHSVDCHVSHIEGANSYECKTCSHCDNYMSVLLWIHIVSITIQCKECVHTVVTMWSLCVHIVDYVLILYEHTVVTMCSFRQGLYISYCGKSGIGQRLIIRRSVSSKIIFSRKICGQIPCFEVFLNTTHDENFKNKAFTTWNLQMFTFFILI